MKKEGGAWLEMNEPYIGQLWPQLSVTKPDIFDRGVQVETIICTGVTPRSFLFPQIAVGQSILGQTREAWYSQKLQIL